MVQNHLDLLYDNMIEQNLLRVIEPFSRVEVDHVAELVSLGKQDVENKYVMAKCV